MTSIPKKVEDRLIASLKRFQPILGSAKARDVNESDTVIIVTDMISEVFGFDKYTDISSEHAIRGTFCDLAINIEGKIQLLVEVKAIGLELKDNHVKQAVDYAANKGVDWVILTNGTNWRMYKISFGKPIDQELVLEIDFLKLNLKNDDDIDTLYLLTKEGWQKQVMVDYAVQKQALSRFFIAGMVLSDPVLDVIRKELKKTCPDVKIKNEQIQSVLLQEVLKRDVVEGEKAEDAKKKISRAMSRSLHARDSKVDGANPSIVTPAICPTPPESTTTAPG
ncbi:MAG: hypothetical protein JWR19_3791 [Pedosphaera sp.]|nr:hypothetical protein [Pedosphaera sp.]